MHIKTLALVAAMSLSALSASAATLSAGEINKTQQTFVEAGDFTDVYLFNLDFPPPADVGFSFIEMKFKAYTDIVFGADAIQFGYGFDGTSVIQTHMTNSRLTDPEILETRFPVLLEEFSVRAHSGGEGMYRGGDGAVRSVCEYILKAQNKLDAFLHSGIH